MASRDKKEMLTYLHGISRNEIEQLNAGPFLALLELPVIVDGSLFSFSFFFLFSLFIILLEPQARNGIMQPL